MLHQDVRALAEDPEVPASVRAVAARLAERYAYPVDFQIIDGEGRMFAQAEANDHSTDYGAVLREGLVGLARRAGW